MFRKDGSSTGQVTAAAVTDQPDGGGGQNGGGGNGRGGKGKGKKGGKPLSSVPKKSSARIDVPLRKSDRRRLRDRFVEAFGIPGGDDQSSKAEGEGAAQDGPSPSESEEKADAIAIRSLVDDLFTDSRCELSARKLKMPDAGNVTLYVRQGGNGGGATGGGMPERWPYRTSQVVLLEVEDEARRKHLVPSAALLSVLPTVVPAVLVHPATTKFLCRGADLMRSGVSPRALPPSAELDRAAGIVAVRAAGNPQPFAAGFVTPGTDPSSVGGGASGVGVQIATCYGDDVWREQRPDGEPPAGGTDSPLGGGCYDDGNYGNVGFLDGKVVAALQASQDDDSGEDTDGGDSVVEEDGSDNSASALVEAADSALKIADSTEYFARGEEAAAAVAADAPTAAPRDPPGGGQDASQSEHQNEEDDPDDVLLRSFRLAVVSLSPKSDLPMPVSTFYAKHVLASRPPGTEISMKQTSWKKIGPFLSEQAETGVIKVGPSQDGRDRVAFVTDADRKHIDLRDARMELKERRAADGGADSSSGKKKLAIVNLYCISTGVRNALRLSEEDTLASQGAKSVERRGTPFLTMPECRVILDGYIASEGLVNPRDPSKVRLDGPLCDALFKASKKDRKSGAADGNKYPEQATRKDLNDRWIGRMDRAHALVEMPGSKILSLKRGAPAKVRVEVISRQGTRKFTTMVRDLEEYSVSPTAFATDVSRRFACAAAVETEDDLTAGRPALRRGRAEIVLQGNLAAELTALLTGEERLTGHGGAKGGEYGLPKGSVDVKLRKNVPARKRD